MPLLSGPVTSRVGVDTPADRSGTETNDKSKDTQTSQFQDLLAAMAAGGVMAPHLVVPANPPAAPGGEVAPTVPDAAGAVLAAAGGLTPLLATGPGPLAPAPAVPGAGAAPTSTDLPVTAAGGAGFTTAPAATGRTASSADALTATAVTEATAPAATEATAPAATEATAPAVSGATVPSADGPAATPAGLVAGQADLPRAGAVVADPVPGTGATGPEAPALPGEGPASDPQPQQGAGAAGHPAGQVVPAAAEADQDPGADPQPSDSQPGTGTPEALPAGSGEPPAPVNIQAAVATPAPAQQTAPVSTASADRSTPAAPAQQLAAEIVPLRDKSGEHSLTISLHPVDLGPVTVTARVQGSDIHLDLGSATEAGREALRSALPELRRELERAGFTSTLFDTGAGGSPRERNGPWDQAPRHQPVAGRDPATRPDPTHPRTSTGVLDLHA